MYKNKKKLISHRGNVNGKNIKLENSIVYIQEALNLKYDVEIDVWNINEKWYLGHDKPQNEIKFDFLMTKGLWLHAKNGDAFFKLLKNKKCNVFWHTNEDWVLTSKKYIWTYPNKYLYPNSICVLPELGYNGNINDCYGICSDEIKKYKQQ
jgi:hypothetical protein